MSKYIAKIEYAEPNRIYQRTFSSFEEAMFWIFKEPVSLGTPIGWTIVKGSR